MLSEIVLTVLVVVAVVWGLRQRRELAAERVYWQRRRTTLAERDMPQLFLDTAAAIEEGLLLIDHSHRIRFANAAIERMLNVDVEAIQGQGVIVLLRDYQADSLIKAAIERGEAQSTTLQLPLSAQTLRMTCCPLDDSSSFDAIVLLHDITHLTQLERARRELVANVSHELRTPLASVRLLVETLQGSPPPDIARRMLDNIDHELEAMTHLIDELRELSQIESGRTVITLQATDLGAIVERAAERLQPQAERRNLRLTADVQRPLPAALIDGERVGQVLLNLLNNALKFTPAGGSVTIRVQAVQAADASATSRLARALIEAGLDCALLVTVTDTGIGIPAHEIGRVFERFYKVDRARTRNSGGTGLGLAIAKHLIERHGGRIWVDSRESEGSTFSLILPPA